MSLLPQYSKNETLLKKFPFSTGISLLLGQAGSNHWATKWVDKNITGCGSLLASGKSLITS